MFVRVPNGRREPPGIESTAAHDVRGRGLCGGMARGLWAVVLAAGCGGRGPEPAPAPAPAKLTNVAETPPPAEPTLIAFDEVTETVGITFRHVSGNSPEKHFPAANGSGVAMLDFDNDGWQDLYYLTARYLPFKEGSEGPRNKLYRNVAGKQFEDVAAVSGLDLSLFCHGVVQGDLNCDGFIDLALTTYGGTRIWRNNGDGTFSAWPGFRDHRWGSSAAMLDYDNDGQLDLYTTHYGLWSIETNQNCGDTARNIRTFCSPKLITPTAHALYRNLGDDRFEDVTRQVGIARTDGRGQGVIATDCNRDGYIDLFCANDICPNFLFLNTGKGTFRDVTEYCGAAFNRDGNPMAGMGTDCADVDGDGLPDILTTNFRDEYNAIWINIGEGTFVDKSHLKGVAADSMDEVGWGTRLVDLDNDTLLDIFVTNGHVDDNVKELHPRASYQQLAKVWRNEGNRFRYVKNAGPFFEKLHVGRGAAFGDYDNDGRIDIAVAHVDSPAALLRNVSPPLKGTATPWIRLSLVGTLSNRDAIGAAVTLNGKELPRSIVRQRDSGASYLSTHDQRLLIGIGAARQVDQVEVKWPSGKVLTLRDVPAGAELLVREPLE